MDWLPGLTLRMRAKQRRPEMNAIRIHDDLGQLLDRLQSPLLAATRCWVGWQFLKAGWLKLSQWDSTVELFRYEYQVPLLTPTVAAVTGTVGELVFPVLLILGLFARAGALGLFAVNLLAVVSYWHVLGQEGFEAAVGQHLLWGFMLLVLSVCGAGNFSLDRLLERTEAGRKPRAAN
jgi:putative oxidoreductase